jgi:hypothetical protein
VALVAPATRGRVNGGWAVRPIDRVATTWYDSIGHVRLWPSCCSYKGRERLLRLRMFLAVAVCTAAVSAMGGAGSAFAGEITGNGKTTPVADDVAASICSFSGRNDENFLPPTDPDFQPERVQSWGQIPKEIRDIIAAEEHPGIACNGHTGFFAGP